MIFVSVIFPDFSLLRFVFNRHAERLQIAARHFRIFQTVEERPFVFHRGIICFRPLVFTQIITARARFGVGQSDRFLFAQLRFASDPGGCRSCLRR